MRRGCLRILIALSECPKFCQIVNEVPRLKGLEAALPGCGPSSVRDVEGVFRVLEPMVAATSVDRIHAAQLH